MSTKKKNVFAPNAREKTLTVTMTRSRGGKTYTIDKVQQVEDINQYSYSTTKLNKRQWTQEFKNAEVTVL